MTNQERYDRLRPVERRILTMRREGVSVDEIAERLKKTPRFVERVIDWTQIPRSDLPRRRTPTPLQRVVMKHRANGASHEDIGKRFKKSGRFIRQVEGLAHLQIGMRLLSTAAHQARYDSRS